MEEKEEEEGCTLTRNAAATARKRRE